MDPVVLHEIQRDNISTSEMIALAGVYEELGLPTFSELILGLPGDSYERHVNSISQVVDAGINVVEVYSCMLLNGTKLISPFSRATHKIGSHFRILPCDFGKLRNGRVAVEIEEVITSTNTLTFEDYQEARKLHLMVAVVYNGGGLSPLLKLMRQKKVPIVQLLQKLVKNIARAPAPVQEIFESFVRMTKGELWRSEEELRAFICTDSNYDKLLKGEIGVNLIQTHTARSLAVMDEWIEYIFEAARTMLEEELAVDADGSTIFNDIHAFCRSRAHNIWGLTATKIVLSVVALQYRKLDAQSAQRAAFGVQVQHSGMV